MHRFVRSFINITVILLVSGCTRFDLLNATIPAGCSTRSLDIPYGPDPRQKLDIYRPASPDPAKGIVVFFYGGDWQNGNKHDYRFVGKALASRGFIAVLPDYRLYPQVTFPTFVDDGALAVRWTHEHAAKFGGDPRQLFLMGHSAGAHIAALLTLDKRYLESQGLSTTIIRATAGLSGPYDFVPSKEDRPVFGMAENDDTPPPDIEPIHFVDGHAPPMLLVQGCKDTVVNPKNTTQLAARIRQAGGDVCVVEYPSRGHEGVVLSIAWSFRWLAPTLDDVTRYFREMEHREPATQPSSQH